MVRAVLYLPLGAAVMASVLMAPQPWARSQAQAPPLVGAVHGEVIADLPGSQRVAIPGAKVSLRAARTPGRAPLATATANLRGLFATPMQPAGVYTLCATAPGFAETCAPQPVNIVGDTVFVTSPLALRPLGGVVQGQVTLKDGQPAVRADSPLGLGADAAQVTLTDAAGKVVAGPVGVNAAGRYVLAGVSAGSGLTLRAAYGQAAVAQPLSLAAADLSAGKTIDLALPASPPVITAVTMTLDGKAVSAAPPGSTVMITVQATDPQNAPLHFSWATNTTGLAAADAASVTWRLPSTAGADVLFGEVTNGLGGVARFSLTVPTAPAGAAGAAGASPMMLMRTGAALDPRQWQIGPLKFPGPPGPVPLPCIPCILSTYVPPAHQGNFIDPIQMMNGACSTEAACETEAISYYQSIGALDSTGKPTATLGTFKAWKQTYGFSADPTTPAAAEVRATYYNNADLQFGRDMHCVTSGGKLAISTYVACYVSNYGAGTTTFGSDPQTAIANAAANTGRIATVAMVYSQSKLVRVGGTRPPPIVEFFVFNNTLNGDGDDGSLLEAAILDSQGPKAVPGVCIACHGGNYVGSPTHNVQTANFLPFDAPSFIYSTANTRLLESAQRDTIRQLNGFVQTAAPRPTIPQLITGWYGWCGGVGTKGCYVDDVGHPFYPNAACNTASTDFSSETCGWPATWGGQQAQSVYQHVPRVYCRTCHVAQSNFLNVQSFRDWTAQVSTIQSYVLASQASPPGLNYMPFAAVPYNGLWNDFPSQTSIAAFLKATGP